MTQKHTGACRAENDHRSSICYSGNCTRLFTLPKCRLSRHKGTLQKASTFACCLQGITTCKNHAHLQGLCNTSRTANNTCKFASVLLSLQKKCKCATLVHYITICKKLASLQVLCRARKKHANLQRLCNTSPSAKHNMQMCKFVAEPLAKNKRFLQPTLSIQ